MNMGIVMIGLALILISVAMMVTPSAAIAPNSLPLGCRDICSYAGDPIFNNSYGEFGHMIAHSVNDPGAPSTKKVLIEILRTELIAPYL